MAFEQRIEQIVADRQHGSSWLAAEICAAFLSLKGTGDYRQRVHWALSRLRNVDTSMAVVHHLIGSLNPIVDGDFFAGLDRYQQRWANVHLPITHVLLQSWNFSSAPILLHSHSGLVQQVIGELLRLLENLNVVQTRSMPGAEGEIQARQLREGGVPVQLIDDDQVAAFAANCQAAILGVDQFTAERFVNKVGSGLITDTLSSLGKPVFVVGDSRKRVSTLHFSSSLFEAVPFGACARLVTEQGIQR